MRLTNYWWLLLWLAMAGVFLNYAFPRVPVRVMREVRYRWSWIAVIILMCPYTIWCMNRSGFGDTETYRITFFNAPASLGHISAYLSQNTKDRGFSVAMILLKSIIGNNDKIFFLLIAAFQMFCVAYFFRKYSRDFLFCVFMFVASTDYLSWMFNGMRQFIAVCIILLGTRFMLERRYVLSIAVILLASSFHGSALMMIPILFVIQGKAWNRNTLFLIVAVIVSVMFIGQFVAGLDSLLADTQYSDMITNEIWTTDDGTNILRVIFYSIPAILSLFGKRYIDDANSPIINLCVNCSICTMCIYLLSAFSSGIYIGRLPIYTTLQGYVAVPWMIDHMFSETTSKLVKMGLIVLFLVFYYVQMHMAWGII